MSLSSRIRRSKSPLPQRRRDPLIPGPETNWETYSAHGEPVLSGIASLVLHGLVLLVIVSGLAALFSRSPVAVTEIPPIIVGDGEGEHGGRGNPDGGHAPAGNPAADRDEPRDVRPAGSVPKTANLLELDADSVRHSPTASRVIDADEYLKKKREQSPPLAILGDQLQRELNAPMGPGMKGPGSDGVAGRNARPRIGGNSRGKRVLRWELTFTVSDARHYLQQLEALGAIVAIPDRDGRLATVANLKERPARLQPRDTRTLHRIYWIDDRDESVIAMAAELGLDFTPTAIVAFFPRTLEDELVAKELAYRGLKEEDIASTRFAIAFRGGAAQIRVTDQKQIRPGTRR